MQNFLSILLIWHIISIVVVFDHINRPLFKVILTNSYEEGPLMKGVHTKNREEQSKAMQVSGNQKCGSNFTKFFQIWMQFPEY